MKVDEDKVRAWESVPGDGLRTMPQMGMADCRMEHFAVLEGQRIRPIAQEDRLQAIESIALQPGVPEDVRIHYDTARNLYLYAWHVYRFHVVSEQQVLATLEMALRQALIERGLLAANGKLPNLGTSLKRPRRLMLSQLLNLGREEGLIRNDGFTHRLKWARQLAEIRCTVERIEYMSSHNIAELIVPSDQAEPTREELEHDWLSDFVESLPRMRNEYAHGSMTLHARVLRTFEIVSDLVNQLWPVMPQAAGPAALGEAQHAGL